MTYGIFAIRDLRTGFMNPLVDLGDDSAMRNFAFACAASDSMIGFRPGDFDLYRLGSFDTESGQIVGCLPELVCHATEVTK